MILTIRKCLILCCQMGSGYLYDKEEANVNIINNLSNSFLCYLVSEDYHVELVIVGTAIQNDRLNNRHIKKIFILL